MTTRYTLDQLRADVEAKYGPFVLELGPEQTVVLQPILRLDHDARAQFDDRLRELNALQDDGADLAAVSDAIAAMLRIAAGGHADRLFAVLPDEPAFLLELFERYQARTMPGEAQPSPS
jgi:hypothetical protein